MMKEIYHNFGCENAKWILFLDMDTYFADKYRPIQSVIDTANAMLTAHSQKQTVRAASKVSKLCDIIAQDSPATINTGVLIFRVSDTAQLLLQDWVSSMWQHIVNSVFWQEDQGWLQHVYLKYLQKELKVTLPDDCASKKIGNKRANSLRNLCYAKSLAMLGLRIGLCI